MLTHSRPALKPTAQADNPDVALARALVDRIFAGVRDPVGLALPDGTLLRAVPDPTATVIIREPGVLRALMTRSTDLGAGEALLHGDIAVEGDAESAFAAFDAVGARRTPREWAGIVALSMRLPKVHSAAGKGERGPARLRGKLHSPERDQEAIAYHYDISNDFYRLWLDEQMTYSCAYFQRADDTLEQAQLQKYDLICRKLRLREGDRFLDIGCGWGGLVRFAAREYGAEAVGITLSTNQASLARERIRSEGLASRCRVELVDYRCLAPLGVFDKAASVGMVEHVGHALFPAYFESMYAALRPGGMFLNHGIIAQHGRSRGLRALADKFFPHRSRFVETYVFPDGQLPELAAMSAAAEDAGFEVRDVENLREHYALTLRHWVKRLEANQDRARAIAGDTAYNVWRFYMAGSAHSFNAGRIGVVQMLLARRDAAGRVDVPLTRDDIYR